MNNQKKPTITLAPNGPYIVNNLESLRNSRGSIETRPTIALCRCGASANKPFCDGTHTKIGFSDAKPEERTEDRQDNYVGDDITIHDNRGVCSHAGICTDRLASVFRLKQEPWIDPNGAKAAEIIDTVKQCPSGAISYSVNGVEHRDQDREPTITVATNGPFVVTGGPDIVGATLGDGASKEHFTLCRCGGSKNKPFCDGTHWHNNFADDKN